MTFQQYLSGLRLEKARRLLLESDKKLLDICLECGFSDGKYLNRLFAKRYGCTPKEYRKGQYKPTSAAEPPARLPTVQHIYGETESLRLLEHLAGEELRTLYSGDIGELLRVGSVKIREMNIKDCRKI